MPRPEKASMTVLYKDSVLSELPDQCPRTSIMRYEYDRDNWIEVTVGEQGIELRSSGAQMLIQPLSGNNIEVFMRDRK